MPIINISNDELALHAKDDKISLSDWADEVLRTQSAHKFFKDTKQSFLNTRFFTEIAVKAAIVGVIGYFSSFNKPDSALLYGASVALLMGSYLLHKIGVISEFTYQYSDSKKTALKTSDEPKWQSRRDAVCQKDTEHAFTEIQTKTNYNMKATGAGIVMVFAAFCAFWRGSDVNQTISALAFAGTLFHKQPEEEVLDFGENQSKDGVSPSI